MTEDLSRYSKELKRSVQAVFLRRDEEGKRRILEISDPFKVPCIVVAYWCAEVSGYPDYLKKSVDSLMNFYKYRQILGKPEDCPW